MRPGLPYRIAAVVLPLATGVFKVLVPDNLKPVVANADPINSTFTVGWLDYAQAHGAAS